MLSLVVFVFSGFNCPPLGQHTTIKTVSCACKSAYCMLPFAHSVCPSGPSFSQKSLQEKTTIVWNLYLLFLWGWIWDIFGETPSLCGCFSYLGEKDFFFINFSHTHAYFVAAPFSHFYVLSVSVFASLPHSLPWMQTQHLVSQENGE